MNNSVNHANMRTRPKRIVQLREDKFDYPITELLKGTVFLKFKNNQIFVRNTDN